RALAVWAKRRVTTRRCWHSRIAMLLEVQGPSGRVSIGKPASPVNWKSERERRNPRGHGANFNFRAGNSTALQPARSLNQEEIAALLRGPRQQGQWRQFRYN